ncbi:transcriptional regulator BetI [Kiloniella laminariae]|uniref:HTH-type transcriptional regulator BetI n=1 Tax=Kiloniella laminariae TaxID=454162 RepID=A0ABT4LM33_9PROT|nr:transcriptional regulator BetI [Kiloniella laminariae]MCZ4282134.1 transcriptional regulator BetI [Kiloniella laminariae]
MPKVGMEPIRKQQLIDATIASIHARGFSETSIRQISQAAGVSPGIVHHYFRDKDDLLQSTMRKLLQDLRLRVLSQLALAKTPEERVVSLIYTYLDDHLFEPETVSAWLAFWAHIPHSDKLRRLQKIYEQRQMSTFRHALKQILPFEQADRAACGLVSLIDGLWVRTSLQEKPMERQKAQELVLDYFALLIGKPAACQTR